MTTSKKIFLVVVCGIIILFLIQLIPYGKHHENPKILSEIQWNSSRTRYLFYRACKNCHTNETEWPWYSRFAPASWLIQSDVNEGRANFNVSEWIQERPVNKGTDAANEVKEGDMPPWYYRPAHPEAWMSKSEKEELETGLRATFGEKKDVK
jgi:hypothetical protein